MTIGEMPVVDFNETIAGLEPPNLGGYVVAVGSPFTGIELYGPRDGGLFASLADAEQWQSDYGLLEDSPFADGPSSVVAVFNNYPA
jgi:hypothetical protein